MATKETEDLLKTSKKSQAELVKLESEIEKLRQRLRLLKSEERAEIDEKDEQIRLNHEKIKKLKNDVEITQKQLVKGQLGDERILKKAFRKHAKEIGLIKGKSAEHVVEILEGRVFDLSKKRDYLRYELNRKKEELSKLKNDLRSIEIKCEYVDKNNPSIQRARETENEYQEVKIRILEMKKIQNIFKEMESRLEQDMRMLPQQLDEMEENYICQRSEIEDLKKREHRALLAREKAKTELGEAEAKASHAKQEKDKVMTEFNQVLEYKHTQMVDAGIEKTVFDLEKFDEEKELNQIKQDQENELAFYKNAFEKIKAATGITDIDDVEQRFASQDAISQNLLQLKSRSEDMLEKLKEEKNELQMQMEFMFGVDKALDQEQMEKALGENRQKCEEQELMKLASEAESRRFSDLVAKCKTSLWHTLQLLEHLEEEPNDESSTMSYMSVEEMARQIMKGIEKIQNDLKDVDIQEMMTKMKEEQPYLRKLEEERLMEPMKRRKAAKPLAEIESSSDDEEVGKRGELKKEAQAFADIKQKQRGKGEAFKL